MKPLKLSSMYRTFLRRSYVDLCSLRPLKTTAETSYNLHLLSKLTGNYSTSNVLRYCCSSTINTSTVDASSSSPESLTLKPAIDVAELPHLSDDEFFKLIVDLRDSFRNKTNEELRQCNQTPYIAAINAECVRRAQQSWDLDKAVDVLNMFFPRARLLCPELLFWLLRTRFKRAMKSPVSTMMKYVDAIDKNNFWRAYHINWYHTECTLIRNLDQFNLQQIAALLNILNERSALVVSQHLISNLYDRLMKEIDQVDSRILNVFLLFFSRQRTSNVDFNPLIDHLFKRLPDSHYSVYETTSLLCIRKKIYHPGILDLLAKNLTNRLPQVYVSELETIVSALAFFNYTSENIHRKVIESLETEPLRSILLQHPKRLVKILSDLCLVGVYSYQFVDLVLSEEFLRKTYGKKLSQYTVPREIMILSSCLKEECPDYEGSKLNERLEMDLLSRNATHIHQYLQTDGDTSINLKKTGKVEYRPTPHNEMILDIRKILKKLLGGPEYVHTCYVLPFLPRPDLLFCLDREKNPVKLPDQLMDSVRVDYKNLDKSLRWYVITSANQHPVLKGENTIFYGKGIAKERILRKLGFELITIVEEIWFDFKQDGQKEDYLSKFIR